MSLSLLNIRSPAASGDYRDGVVDLVDAMNKVPRSKEGTKD
jgi:hypothetical protein